MQLKLDELIRSHKSSRNQMIDLEELSDVEMERVHDQFHLIHEKAAKRKDRLIAQKDHLRA
jgi:low affinity Fe/Cu permease